MATLSDLSIMTVSSFLFQIVHQYGEDPSVTAMINKVDLAILPVLNVDGYVYTWTKVSFIFCPLPIFGYLVMFPGQTEESHGTIKRQSDNKTTTKRQSSFTSLFMDLAQRLSPKKKKFIPQSGILQ